MCQISKHLKFCTCNDESFINGNHWIIYRRHKGRFRIGQPIYNENTLKIDENELKELLNKLNTSSLFDFDYKPLDYDKLEINLKFKEKEFEYYFLFLKGKWKKHTATGVFELMNEMELNLPQYTSEYKGKIKNPFKNK